MASVVAQTNPVVLRWAREAAGIDVASAARVAGMKASRLTQAEEGTHQITLRQARLLAKAYGRPPAFLFRPAPPDDEPSAEVKYRTLRGAPPPPWGADLIRVERDVRVRQEAAADLYDALGEEPPWPDTTRELDLASGVPAADVIRAYLSLGEGVLSGGDPWAPRRVAVRAIEWAGVLVVRVPLASGIRGFAVPDEAVPAIVLNSSEHPRAHVFSLLHEFAHLLLAASGESLSDEEAWCEQYAGDVLMPANELRSVWSPTGDPVRRTTAAANAFGVTPLAVAVRARHLGLLTVDELIAVRDRPTEGAKADSGDGNRTKVARLSPTFTDLVLSAASASAVTLSTASRLLRTRVEDFPKLQKIAAQALAE